MAKIFKINQNSVDQKNEEDQQCMNDDVSTDPFDDPVDDWFSFGVDGRKSQGLSTIEMINYFQDRYNNSDILPSIKDAFISISLTVRAADSYIANYNESIPIMITRISDLEGESFHLGQKLNISTVENIMRNKTISRMKIENATVTTNLSNLKNKQNDELAQLQRLHALQKSLVYDPSFLGSIYIFLLIFIENKIHN
jgi:hypothetical protein